MAFNRFATLALCCAFASANASDVLISGNSFNESGNFGTATSTLGHNLVYVRTSTLR